MNKDKAFYKTPYLVYLIKDCEKDSEEFYHAIAYGETDEELYIDWMNQMEKIYDVILSRGFLTCSIGNGETKWFFACYELIKKELPISVYGRA